MRPTDLQFNSASVEAMIGELKEHYEDGSFNGWEDEFYESIRDRVSVELTRKQFDKLRAIYETYCE